MVIVLSDAEGIGGRVMGGVSWKLGLFKRGAVGCVMGDSTGNRESVSCKGFESMSCEGCESVSCESVFCGEEAAEPSSGTVAMVS